MPRKPNPEKRSADILAPLPAEILDQIVRDGPLTAADASIQESGARARVGRRAAAPCGVRAGPRYARSHDQSAQWDERQDRADR
jgi:hypothetical protein